MSLGSAASPHGLTVLALFATQRLPLLMVGGAVGVFAAGNRRVRLLVLRVFAAMALAWMVAKLGQHFIAIDRPFVQSLGLQWLAHGTSHSFPSAHASVVFGLATATALTSQKAHWALLAWAAAALVAWSRVYLGLHFPSDVLAGAVVGVASAWLVCRLHLRQATQAAAS